MCIHMCMHISVHTAVDKIARSHGPHETFDASSLLASHAAVELSGAAVRELNLSLRGKYQKSGYFWSESALQLCD